MLCQNNGRLQTKLKSAKDEKAVLAAQLAALQDEKALHVQQHAIERQKFNSETENL